MYEALFLVDSAEAAGDWDGINEHIKKVFDRNDGKVVSIRKWDERQLAYSIMGRNRGTYILVYFNSLSDKIASIERDCQLSERIMRVLILRADHMAKEDVEKEASATAVERQAHKPADSHQNAAVDNKEKAADKNNDIDEQVVL